MKVKLPAAVTVLTAKTVVIAGAAVTVLTGAGQSLVIIGKDLVHQPRSTGDWRNYTV